MHRRFLKEARCVFPKSVDEYNQQVEQLLRHRRTELDAAWEELEKGWDAHNERVVTLKVRPRTDGETVFKLNVGGSNVTVCWHLLAEAEGFEDSILGALLEGVWGEGRIPRDADGRIVLDESAACMKHIIDAMLTGRSSSVAAGLHESSARSALAMDEAPCLIYTAHVMGLPGSVRAHPTYLKLNEGGTVLEPFEIAPLGAKIREWAGGSTEEMTLIYRATRDGFDPKSFKPRCNEDRPHTVSLIRVRSGQENDDDSIVGGYSVMPWGSDFGSKRTITAQTFVFMLKDGSATRKDPSKPTKWAPYPKRVASGFSVTPTRGNGFSMTPMCGVCVGGNDLFVWLHGAMEACTLGTGRDWFDIEEDSPFLALQGKEVVDIEVYRFSTPAPPTTTTAPSVLELEEHPLADAEAPDIHSFGKSIASSLMEERVVLHRAVKEMEAAGARVSAAVGALETVYGPSVAAGEQDAVVELNVRGTRMTTLRSTLQACPRSALAAMFNEDRWPATDTAIDECGKRLIDCDRACFSKILDVLRMRKRASWSRGATGGEQEEEAGKKGGGGGRYTIDGSGAVLIKKADVEAFGAAVNMYFPGCESFIMGLVQSV